MIKLKKINSVRMIIALVLLIWIVNGVNALSTNGSNLNNNFAVTSGKNADSSSSNFINYLTVGDITATSNSSNFKTNLGFIRTAHYVDGEACQINAECAGDFCCSSVCQSTACPVEEEEVPSGGGAGAGGGGGGGFILEHFILSKNFIKAVIKQGDTYQTSFTIKNTHTGNLAFNIDYSELDEIMLLSDTEFELEPDEVQIIDVMIFAGEKKIPDVYSGNIKITADDVERSLPVIVEIRAKKALFDILVTVPPQSKYVLKDESVVADITLINVGDLKPVDVTLSYSLRDIEGNEVVFGFETLAVYDQVSRIKELELPRNISTGTYLFYSKVTVGIESAASGDVFYVVDEKPVSCFDGIQNQDETGIDCGGSCNACKRKFLWGIKPSSIIFFGLMIIVFVIIIYAILRKSPKMTHAETYHKELHKLYNFIDSALNKGYKSDYIKSSLLSRGLSQRVVNKMHHKVVSDKLDKLKEIDAAKPKHKIEKPVKIPKKLERQVDDYIDKALNLGHTPRKIEKTLIKIGWPKSEIKKQISKVLRIRMGGNL